MILFLLIHIPHYESTINTKTYTFWFKTICIGYGQIYCYDYDDSRPYNVYHGRPSIHRCAVFSLELVEFFKRANSANLLICIGCRSCICYEKVTKWLDKQRNAKKTLTMDRNHFHMWIFACISSF